MKKVYGISKEDLEKIGLYTDRLMELGLNSVELDPNNGHPAVTFDGHIGDILMALEHAKKSGINLLPRECPLYPTRCPKGDEYRKNETLYCKSPEFDGCGTYQEKQLRKTNV